MATSAVVSGTIFQEIQNFYHDRRADLRQLGNALQSGNLDAAKQAFSELAALGKSGPYGNTEPFSGANRAQAFEAIGQALQAGDLAGAKTAFAKLLHHQGVQNAGQGSPAAIVNISGTQNTTGTGNIADTESIYQQLQDFRAGRKTDIAQLGTALQAGDKAAAQKAYDALVALGKSGPNANGEAFSRADRAQDFEAIGTALKAGDLASAQQAFANLAATFDHPVPTPKEPPIYPNPTPGPVPEVIINLGGGGSATPTPVTTTPAPTPAPVNTVPGPVATPISTTPEIVINVNNSGSSKPEEIQINFGSNGSGGHLTIDVSQLQGNKPGEQIKIDFNSPGGNSELIVNLFNPGSSTPASSSSLNLQA